MKKFMLILVVILASCANPVVEEEPVIDVPVIEKPTNPFVGTWKNMTAASFGSNVGFTFRDDGTYTYWHSFGNTNGSGKYSYNEKLLIFSNSTVININGTFSNLYGTNEYEWQSDNQFRLSNNRELYTGGLYVRQ